MRNQLRSFRRHKLLFVRPFPNSTKQSRNEVGSTESTTGRLHRMPHQILKRKSVEFAIANECGLDDQQCWHYCPSCKKEFWHPVNKGTLIDRFFKLCDECKKLGLTGSMWKAG